VNDPSTGGPVGSTGASPADASRGQSDRAAPPPDPSPAGRPPSGLERLWRREELDRAPRLGLSLERVVQSGIELADGDGLAAVSMKRVAEHLGFTTMSLYRYVASKDDLLLLMHDTCWTPPSGLDASLDGWRAGLVRWTREQHEIVRRHPWLDDVRMIERAGTPSQLAWMDLGLRTLAGTPLPEQQKLAVLLLLAGYAALQMRLAGVAVEAGRQEDFAPDQATEAFGAMIRAVVTPDRFPALHRAIEGGAFAPVGRDTYAAFDFGLDLMLDGVEELIARHDGGSVPPARN
jgi:AcrR family transcriptional regulator